MKLLVVDDDESIRAILTLVLEQNGVTDVTLAASSADAMKFVKSTTVAFDCFLLDIQMPGGDGIDLCRAIRELPDYHETPIIMISAMNDKEYVNRSYAAGATDYLTKPLDLPAFGKKIGFIKNSLQK